MNLATPQQADPLKTDIFFINPNITIKTFLRGHIETDSNHLSSEFQNQVLHFHVIIMSELLL